MSAPSPWRDPMAEVAAILDTYRIMSIATQREDGWPQVTQVNYFRDGLRLYFVVARDSQKFANIARDGRVGLALGGPDAGGRIRGLSMAARAQEIIDPAAVGGLNKLIWAQPQDRAFVPHPTGQNAAVFQASPILISLIDGEAAAQQTLFRVVEDWRLEAMLEG